MTNETLSNLQSNISVGKTVEERTSTLISGFADLVDSQKNSPQNIHSIASTLKESVPALTRSVVSGGGSTR